MRAIAEYSMRGRRQAIIVVLLCGFLPLLNLISFAVIGLVSLRRSTQDALLIALWGMVPAILLLAQGGDPSAAITVPTVLLLARVLKSTDSWQNVLVVATGIGLIAQLCLPVFTAYLATMDAGATRVVNMMINSSGSSPFTAEDLQTMMRAGFGAGICMSSALCLMLARWWQACAVNPGGFGTEFRAMKFAPAVAALFLAALLAGFMGLVPLDGFSYLMGIAPTLVGLAVAHGLVRQKKLPGPWLAGVYVALLTPAVTLLGLLDSVVDFRQRLRDRDAKNPANDESGEDRDE